MKKILTVIILITALTLVLVMSGCSKQNEPNLEGNLYYNLDGNRLYYGCVSPPMIEKLFREDSYDACEGFIEFYTQEEVDALLDTLIELTRYTWAVDDNGIYLVDDTVNDINERVYDIESELRDFERFEYEDLIEFMDYFDDDDLFLKELNEYLNKEYMMFTEDLWTEFIIEYGGILHNTYQTQIDELEERIEILENE
jgi:hypothetical protein